MQPAQSQQGLKRKQPPGEQSVASPVSGGLQPSSNVQAAVRGQQPVIAQSLAECSSMLATPCVCCSQYSGQEAKEGGSTRAGPRPRPYIPCSGPQQTLNGRDTFICAAPASPLASTPHLEPFAGHVIEPGCLCIVKVFSVALCVVFPVRTQLCSLGPGLLLSAEICCLVRHMSCTGLLLVCCKSLVSLAVT